MFSKETPHNRSSYLLLLIASIVAITLLTAPTVAPVMALPNNQDIEPMTIHTCFYDYRYLPPQGGDVVRYPAEYPYTEVDRVRIVYANLNPSDYYWDWWWDHHYLRIIIINYSEALPLKIKWQVCLTYH